MTRLSKALSVLLVLTMTACSWTSKDGTRKSLVVGVGIISTKDLAQGNATVTHTSLVGLALVHTPAQNGLVAGYQDLTVTQIPPAWEGHFQLTLGPSSQSLTVDSPSNPSRKP